MSEECDLLFHIVYQEQESPLQISKYDTVGDLKNRIFMKFGIPPHKQLIECWHQSPDNDADILLTCCLKNDINFLVVYNAEINFQNDHRPRENVNSSGTITEISSVLTFVQYFSTNFPNSIIPFRICCIENAFNQTTEQKQILLLYLHNARDNFATIFCEQLTKPETQTIINNFFLLCWDIENEDYHNVLIEALQKHNEVKSFDHFIRSKTSAALFLAPRGNRLMVVSVLTGNISSQEIVLTVRNAEKFLASPIRQQKTEENKKHSFGSRDYQQLMLDMLGDRDYDSFDFYEADNLKEKIRYAFYGPPKTEEECDEKKQKNVDIMFKTILTENNFIAKRKDRVIISFIYLCMEPLPEEKQKRAKKYPDYDPESDLTPIPLFILRKCKNSDNSCRVVIDETGRVYKSWQQYLLENKLGKCQMVFPKDGRYQADSNGNVILGRKLSPACSPSSTILQGADIASAVGGIASGGVMVAAATIPAVAAAPLLLPAAAVAGVSAGAYSLCRSAYALYDRSKHNENMSFFESPEARGAYINLVAGSLGFVGTGANAAVSKLAAEGFNIGKGATAAVNTLNIVNLGTSGAGIVNGSYDVIRNWKEENEKPSMLTIVQLSSSVFFFGHAVYNYRSVNTIIEETQTNTLKEYQESLRSNRHRKTFTKLLKETVRQSDGNVQRGQAEVIATIKNIQNKDEVFATLTRANKAMNKNGVRFAASDGKVTLNGVSIDMKQFTNMDKTEVITFLTHLPNKPNPSTADIKGMSVYIKTTFPTIPGSEIMALAVNLVKIFGATDSVIKEKIINSVALLIKILKEKYPGYIQELDRIFPNRDKYVRLFGMMNDFFQTLVRQMEEKYNEWAETGNHEEPYFVRWLSMDAKRRIEEIFNFVTENYFDGTQLTQLGVDKIFEYFRAWFAQQVYAFEARQERRQRRREHSGVAAQKRNCSECGGYFYAARE